MDESELVHVSRANGESIDLDSWRAASASARVPRQRSDASNERGKLDRDTKLSPLIVDELDRRGIRVSDCIIIDERTVQFP